MLLLKVDYDGPRLPKVELARRMDRAHRQIVGLWDRKSPSGRGWHRYIALEPPPRRATEVVALQLLAGSDPLREAYCLNRAVQVDRGGVSAYWKARWDVLYTASTGRKPSRKPVAATRRGGRHRRRKAPSG